MKAKKAKNKWASLVITPDGSVLVGVLLRTKRVNYFYKSLQALKEDLDRGLLHVEHWIISVPRILCIMKEHNLPAKDIHEAVQMIEFEIPSVFPVRADTVAYSCLPNERKESLFCVNLCIIPKMKLDSYLKPIRDVGINPERVVLDTMAKYAWLKSENLVSENVIGIFCVVDKNHLDVIVSLAEQILCLKNVSYDISDLEHIADIVCGEIDDAVEKNVKNRDYQIFMAGEKAIVDLVKIKSTQSVNIIGLVVNKFERQVADDPNHAITGEYYSEVLQAEGLTEIFKKNLWPYFNFLGSDINSYKFIKKNKDLVVSIALSLLLVVLAWLSLWTANLRVQRQCFEIEKMISQIKNVATDIESKQSQIKAINSQIDNRGLVIKALAELYRYTPKQVSFSKIVYSCHSLTDLLQVTGKSDSYDNIWSFIEEMNKTKYLNAFGNVKYGQTSRVGSSYVELSAECQIKGELK